MKKWFYAFVIVFLVDHAHSQTNDFIETDSTFEFGVRLIEGSRLENSQFIRLKKGKEVIQYSPRDIKSYGFKGNVFESLSIITNGREERWFFRRVVKGKLSIYFLPVGKREKFFVKSDDDLALKEIPNDGLENFLREHVKDCDMSVKNAKHVKLKENSIARFFKDYDGCSNSYLPRFRYSLSVGVNVTGLSANNAEGIVGSLNYEQTVGFRVGFTIISQIEQSNFALITGPTFQTYKSSNQLAGDDFTYDAVINQSRLNLPLLLRYSFYKSKSIPFIEFGPSYSRFLNGTSSFYSYETINNSVYIEREESSFIDEHQIGLAFGSGIIIDYDANLSFSGRIGFEKWYPTRASDNLLGVNQIVITLGVLF